MFNKPSEKINLNSPDPNSDIYISEGERFNKDFAAYDYNRRNIEHERKKEMYQNKKNILYEREKKRWEKMDYEYLKAENKIMMNKERNLVGRKNNPGMAFNPLTLQYDNSVQGEILKKRDDESKFRALMRATNIDKHANAGYNIINGEERNIMENRMLKEIEPSVYKKNIDKIKQINQRHNDNDNFYTKGPSYSQAKNKFVQMPEQNELYNNNINNEYQQMPQKEDFKNIPPNENNRKRMTPSNIDDRNITPNNNNYNNIPPNDNNYQRMIQNDKFNNKSPQENKNYPNEKYQRMTPQNNDYKDNIPPNDNNQRMSPQNNNNYNNIPNNREYLRAPYSENNYRRMTPSNHGYDQIKQNENIPEHYSEQDKYERRYQTVQNDFDRQYNYMGKEEQNNYENYKNQEYNNGKQTPNGYYPRTQNFNERDSKYNGNRDPYARRDYYYNNSQRTMG